MLSKHVKQSHRALSVDSSIAKQRAFCAVTVFSRKNMAVTSVNCQTPSSWLVLIFSTELKMWICHRWGNLKIIFRVLALRQSELEMSAVEHSHGGQYTFSTGADPLILIFTSSEWRYCYIGYHQETFMQVLFFPFFFFSLRRSFYVMLRRKKKKKLKVVNMLPVWRRMEYHSSHYQITYCMVIVTQ